MHMQGTREQLCFESVGCDDERLRQQLQLESLDEIGRTVALAIVTQHRVAYVSNSRIVDPSTL